MLRAAERMMIALLATALLGSCSAPTSDKTTQGLFTPLAETKPDKAPQFTPAEGPPLRIDPARTMRYLQEIVAFGRRAPGSPGHNKLQAYLRRQLSNDQREEDTFSAETPAGKFQLTNFVAKFPGSTDEIVVLATHYDTNYPLPTAYVGANDGGSSTALLLEIANQLRRRKLTGPSVWLIFFDGEEPFKQWTDTDSLYGSRHLAAKWQADGTAKKIRAFILADMIGDRDLNIDRDANSAPWLSDLVLESARHLSVAAHFFARETAVEDDHVPFSKIGVPAIDLIDLDYGYANALHHSTEDTLDKVSARSIEIVGNVMLETIRRLGVGCTRNLSG